MRIDVSDPVNQTIIFAAIFLVCLLLSIRKAKIDSFFPPSLTTELKGFAILAIIFSHIGYFLSKDDHFLFPLSILAGVGVNLFLFLSGLGLTNSALRKPLSVFNFYKKRLLKLFVPLWLILIVLVLVDHFWLGITYSRTDLIENFLGYFPHVHIFESIDSPLWYFTLIFFYYLIFPLLFFKKYKYISCLLIFVVSFLVLKLPLPLASDVFNLYKLHFIAFPLGVLFAVSTYKITNINYKLLLPLLPLLIAFFVYTSFNSGVGQDQFVEQATSLLTMFSAILLFLIKNFEFKLFSIFGIFSYEVYLIHWPILLRYGMIYQLLPAWLATVIYLVLFIIMSFLLQKLIKKLPLL